MIALSIQACAATNLKTEDNCSSSDQETYQTIEGHSNDVHVQEASNRLKNWTGDKSGALKSSSRRLDRNSFVSKGDIYGLSNFDIV